MFLQVVCDTDPYRPDGARQSPLVDRAVWEGKQEAALAPGDTHSHLPRSRAREGVTFNPLVCSPG